jgi:hypothetical protein
MKGIILGTDILEQNGVAKILEINTNTTIFNSGADMLDYDGLFSMLIANNITEFHLIYTEGDSHIPLTEPYRFAQLVESKCEENNIEYFSYVVPKSSVTVPYIEDASNKFILRQAYDTTALVDETYCADKFGFFELMSGSEYIPKTFISSSLTDMDTIDVLNFDNGNEPNLIEKHRYPQYEQQTYPALYSINTAESLTNFKETFDVASNNLLQEFIYNEANIVDGRYSTIRSIDILYGSNLDTINMGGYRQSTIIPLEFSPTELLDTTRKVKQKSRYKFINKGLEDAQKIDYHTDDDSSILDYTGSLKDVDTIKLGDYIKSIDFTDLNGTSPSGDRNITVLGWDGTLEQTSASLVNVQSELESIVSASVETMYIRITLENGENWTDSPSCTYYIEESGSLSTRFDKVNKMVIGDKLVTMDPVTNELSLLAVTNLQMEYAEKTIYALDFEPSDLFLVDIGNGLFSIMHNQCWCPWNFCGYFCHQVFCRTCFTRFVRK